MSIVITVGLIAFALWAMWDAWHDAKTRREEASHHHMRMPSHNDHDSWGRR
jgi:ABC-type nickel/cobalt efflux system permease component RcnA